MSKYYINNSLSFSQNRSGGSYNSPNKITISSNIPKTTSTSLGIPINNDKFSKDRITYEKNIISTNIIEKYNQIQLSSSVITDSNIPENRNRRNVRMPLDALAIRQDRFDLYRGKFDIPFPLDSNYNFCPQRLTVVYNNGCRQQSRRTTGNGYPFNQDLTTINELNLNPFNCNITPPKSCADGGCDYPNDCVPPGSFSLHRCYREPVIWTGQPPMPINCSGYTPVNPYIEPEELLLVPDPQPPYNSFGIPYILSIKVDNSKIGLNGIYDFNWTQPSGSQIVSSSTSIDNKSYMFWNPSTESFDCTIYTTPSDIPRLETSIKLPARWRRIYQDWTMDEYMCDISGTSPRGYSVEVYYDTTGINCKVYTLQPGAVTVSNSCDGSNITSVPLPFSASSSMNFDADNNKIYVSDLYGSQPFDSIAIIDTISDSVVDTIFSVGLVFPIDCYIYNNLLYVANTITGVNVIDPVSKNILHNILIPGIGSGGDGFNRRLVFININDTPKLYVIISSGRIAIIDLSTNSLETTIEHDILGNYTFKDGAFNSTNNTLYITSENISGPSIFAFDVISNQITHSFDVGTAAWGISVDNINNKAYITAKFTNSLFIIDTVTNTLLDTVVLDNIGRRSFIHYDTNKVYVACDGSVAIIDATTGVLLDTLPINDNNIDIFLTQCTNLT